MRQRGAITISSESAKLMQGAYLPIASPRPSPSRSSSILIFMTHFSAQYPGLARTTALANFVT